MALPLPPAGTFADPALKQGEFKTALEQELAVVAELHAGGGVAASGGGGGGGISTSAPASLVTVGSYLVRGATGQNNATTPDTQYDLSAAQVQLFRPSDGSIVVRQAPGTITVNILTAGPIANGRDQAAAFAASSWIHWYWIWNGTTLAGIASLSAPTGAAGPTLPSGFTFWAYAGALRLNASSQLARAYLRGAWVRYETAITNGPTSMVNAGTATTETVITTSGVIPPNALDFSVKLAATVQHTATLSGFVELLLKSGVVSRQAYTPIWVVNLATAVECGEYMWPNTGYLAYRWGSTGTPATTKNFYMDCTGYRVPNGGE